MENNGNNGVATEQTAVETAQEPNVDYKALYEKLQKDNANLDRYNKDLKAKYQAKLTDEEKQKAELLEKENYYKNLEKELSLSKFKTSLSGRVTDSKVLDEIANKFADGDNYGALSLLAEFETKREATLRKTIEQELLAKNPQTPPQTETNGEITKEQFNKMGYDERVKLINEKPELYEKLSK